MTDRDEKHPLFWTEREKPDLPSASDGEGDGASAAWNLTEVLAGGRVVEFGVEPDPYEPGRWRGFFGVQGTERMGLLPRSTADDARYDIERCLSDLRQQSLSRATRKTEIVLDAALLGADYESPEIVPIDRSKKEIVLRDLFPGASWTWHAQDHLEAPAPTPGADDKWNDMIREHREQGKQKTPSPRVYKIKITVEYAELPELEGQRLIHEAYEKSLEKNKIEP
jgi:hypothetical protein